MAHSSSIRGAGTSPYIKPAKRRLIAERDAGEMRVEDRGNGDRIDGRGIRRSADREIDEDVFNT